MRSTEHEIHPVGAWNENSTTISPGCFSLEQIKLLRSVASAASHLFFGGFFTGAFKTDGQRRNPAFVLLFVVFDETKSWYGEVGERKNREKFKKSIGRKEYHTINGYVNGTLPGNEPERLQARSLFHEVVGFCHSPCVCV